MISKQKPSITFATIIMINMLASGHFPSAALAPYATPSNRNEIIAQATETNPPVEPSNNVGSTESTSTGASPSNSSQTPGFINPTPDATAPTENPPSSPEMGQNQSMNDGNNAPAVNTEVTPDTSLPADAEGAMNESIKEGAPPDNSFSVNEVPDISSHQPGGPSTPLRQALTSINQGNYMQGLLKIDQVLKNNPGNPQAHYLKGVTYMMTHRYHEAESEYQLAIKYSCDPRLKDLARTGLLKLKSREENN
jgi:hypothetical protein